MAVRLAYTIVLFSSVPIAATLIVYAFRRRSVPGAGYFIAIMAAAILYSCFYAAEINARSREAAMLWFDLEHIPIPIQHYLWLMMSLAYAGVSQKTLRVYGRVMLYHPVAYYLIYFTNRFHHLYISSLQFRGNGYFDVLFTVKGPLFFALIASGTLIGLIATAYYFRGYRKAPRLQRGGYVCMIVASLAPWASVYANLAGFNTLGLDYFPGVSVVSGLLYAFGMFRYSLFNAIPIATEAVFRQSRDGVAIMDRLNQIVDANDAFLALYPGLGGLSRKLPFSRFAQEHPELKSMLTGTAKLDFQREENGETRYFSAEITGITSENSRLLIGRILTVEDITWYITYQKQLEQIASSALSRAESNELSFLQAQIKPHFLNNTLSVIASMITRSPEEAKALIAELGEHLANCYYFDDASPMISLEKELENVNTYVSIEKARFRERLNFHLVCGQVPRIDVPRLCIQPLVENAIRHGIGKKARPGNVWLVISEEDERIRFLVKDDGAGMEQAAALALLNAANTGRGIGISNIHKRLCKYYGEGLQITAVPEEGTEVSFLIPRTRCAGGGV